MAILSIQEGCQKHFERKVASYLDKVEDVRDQLNSAVDLALKYADDSDAYNCNIYLKKRRTSLYTAMDTANKLKRKANTYVTNVVNADRDISNSIHKDSYAFYREHKVGPQKDSCAARVKYKIKAKTEDFAREIVNIVKTIAQKISEFYETYKYIINIVADIVKITAAIALFAMSGGTILGIICAVGAAYAVAKAVTETLLDAAALGAHLAGDEEKAQKLSKTTLNDLIISGAQWLDKKFNLHFIEKLAKTLLIGLEICQFAAEMMMFFETFKKVFNINENSSGKIMKCLDHRYKTTYKNSVRLFNQVKWGGTIGNGARFASPLNWIKFGAKIMGFSFKLDAKNTLEFINSLLKDFSKNKSNFLDIIHDPSSILKNCPGLSNTSKLYSRIDTIIYT